MVSVKPQDTQKLEISKDVNCKTTIVYQILSLTLWTSFFQRKLFTHEDKGVDRYKRHLWIVTQRPYNLTK